MIVLCFIDQMINTESMIHFSLENLVEPETPCIRWIDISCNIKFNVSNYSNNIIYDFIEIVVLPVEYYKYSFKRDFQKNGQYPSSKYFLTSLITFCESVLFFVRLTYYL